MNTILFIGGSLNQTRMLHKIAEALPGHNHFFTPFYADGFLQWLASFGLLSFSILGGRHRRDTLEYIKANRLQLDMRGETREYDLVITGTDLIIQQNIRSTPIVLVQEGMMDAGGLLLNLVRKLHLPRWLANTAATGLSDAYQIFCVASQGNRDLFISRGVQREKIRVTGIPNFDNVSALINSSVPERQYILAATSNGRETFKPDTRSELFKLVQTAKTELDLPVLFKLHPNEDAKRAEREIRPAFPEAEIIQKGDIGPMIANCRILVSEYSSVILLGLAMGKEIRCDCDLDEIRKLLPIQNGGDSARRIARIALRLIEDQKRQKRSSSDFRNRRRQGVELLPLG